MNMNEMVDVLVGFKKFTSKKGEPTCYAFVIENASDFDKRYGAIGCKCSEIYIPQQFQNLFNESVLGKKVAIDYKMNGRFAEIVGVSFK